MSEIDKINAAIDEFASAIKTRMGQKYHAGYRGWDGDYPSEKLALELNKDSCELIKLNNPAKAALDIGARAMMLWHRYNQPHRADRVQRGNKGPGEKDGAENKCKNFDPDMPPHGDICLNCNRPHK